MTPSQARAKRRWLALLALAIISFALLAATAAMPLFFKGFGEQRLAWVAVAGLALVISGLEAFLLLGLRRSHHAAVAAQPLPRPALAKLDFDKPWKGGAV